MGTLAAGQPTGTQNTMEVLYMKIEENGRTVLELDKLNFIFVVDGEDMLREVRDLI